MTKQRNEHPPTSRSIELGTVLKVSIVAGVIMLAVAAGLLYRELDHARGKAEKFDAYCRHVTLVVDLMRRDLLNPTPPPWLDAQVRRYFETKEIVDRTLNDLDACATTKIDFHALDARNRSCTAGRNACLAAVLEAIEQHLPSPNP